MMKNKKIPMRTCVVSKEKLPKKDLVRVIRTPEGEVEVDYTGKKNGRGAYLKNSKDIIEKARQTKILEKHLEIKIGDEIYDELINIL